MYFLNIFLKHIHYTYTVCTYITYACTLYVLQDQVMSSLYRVVCVMPFFERRKNNLNVPFQTVSKESGNRIKRIEKLQGLLADPENANYNFAVFDQLALPLDPEVSGKILYI